MREIHQRLLRPHGGFCLAWALLLVSPASAAVDRPPEPEGFLEEVITVATKKSGAEAAGDVPVAINVLDGESLAVRQVTDIEDLSYSLPNVAFDGIGTGKGIANFSIRGLGVAGSIPSIDPTVGVFVDGVYLGVNYGVIADMMDLEAMEVLRGPQGLLFGRNVTGGAVLLRSRRPSGDRSGTASARVETGIDSRFAASVESPLAGGLLNARLSAQYRDDRGWFANDAPGAGVMGADRTRQARGVLTLTPSEAFEVALIHERGDTDSDGPATQNRRRFGGFDFAIDEPGYSRVDWAHVIVEANRQVRFGNGRITNVFGWREVEHDSLADIDSTTDPIFHLFAYTDQSQLSNELRYSGWMQERWEMTAGIYWFTQDIRYREWRILRGARGQPFGGAQDHGTGGLFMQHDFDLGRNWVLTLGARYTLEKKDVRVATAGVNAACRNERRLCVFDFEDRDTWRNLTPKVGLQRWLGSDAQVYAYYTRGFRSGGYNLRNTSSTASPGPFDEERQDSFEAGLKSEFADRRLRLNLAAFHNRVYGMQRQVTRSDIRVGGVQVTANTADATILGFELEATAVVAEGLTVNAFLGYTHGEYDEVRHDLDGDGSTVGDEHLRLPRLAKLSFGVDASYRRRVGNLGLFSARASLKHRDDSEITDDNLGVLDGGDILDASVAYSPSERLRFTLYAKNLLNEVLRRSDFDLSALVDSTYSPLKEGRAVGFEVRGNF